MKQTTLCFLLRGGEVLLAMKKRGFGTGKWNGIGGKLKENEDVVAAAVREIQEEVGVAAAPEALKHAGTLKFHYEGNVAWDQECHVFTLDTWAGEPKESEEMEPQWYGINELPFEAMWVDDPYWLPKILVGETVYGEFFFDANGVELLDHSVTVGL